MKTFYIAETQNLASIRATDKVEAKSLTSAKRIASRNQTFQGTVLKIFDAAGYLVAAKQDGGQWVDYDPANQTSPKIIV